MQAAPAVAGKALRYKHINLLKQKPPLEEGIFQQLVSGRHSLTNVFIIVPFGPVIRK